MSHFRPTRTSPPSKIVTLAGHSFQTSSSLDVSHSSAVSAAELLGLSQHEIEILDAVIERADPSATTFKSIFKPYNDVLVERGVDPQEVLYYKKLLKLGTMKGKNWADKWDLVKKQNGYHGKDHHGGVYTPSPVYEPTPKGVSNRVLRRVVPSVEATEVSSTLGSDETETTTQNGEPIPPRHYPTQSTSHQLGRTRAFNSNKPLDNSKNYRPPPATGKRDVFRTGRVRGPPSDVDTFDGTEDPPYKTPPSYRSSTRSPRQANTRLYGVDAPVPLSMNLDSPSIIVSSATARKVVAMARERKGSVVNEEDAWNKIKMQRDEKDADAFHSDRIMERCWEVWKQGFLWIITTNQQIDEARDNLLLRIHLQRWRAVMISRNELHTQIAELSNRRCLERSLEKWRDRLRDRQQVKWRQMMRSKMKTIKERRDLVLQKDMWTKWRQSYYSKLSDQHYENALQTRWYRRWKSRLSAVDALEEAAEELLRAADDRRVIDYWERWRKTCKMENSAQMMLEKINKREMSSAIGIWKRHMHDRNVGKSFNRLTLMKRMIRTWKTSRDRIKMMENRANKHIARQDGVLLRAVSRVWKARERGKLLERVKNKRLMQGAWEVWKQRIRTRKHNEDLAVVFSQRPSSNAAALTFRKWHEAYVTHRNALSFAKDYHSAQLRYHMLLSWRLRLRDKLNLTKMARRADSYFAARRAYKTWCSAFESRTRERTFKAIERRQVAKIFHKWVQHAQSVRQLRLAEQAIQGQVTKRILETILSRWTNRVIEIKLRELEVVQKREFKLQTLALKKWRSASARHAEELSLMESYQLVKREENIRRMFYRWSSLARAHRHRRITFQKKEDEIKLSLIASAWDRWKGRFTDEKLRPIEYSVIIQTQKNLIFRAFGIWHSKTKSLPAIRFHTTNVKTKYFELWRRGMPRALQSKQAREVDRKATLAKFMAQWVESHRTKMALKAVARARYLRLPTAAPRQKGPMTQTAINPLSNRNIFPRRIVEDETDNPVVPRSSPSPPPFKPRTPLADYSRMKARSETSFAGSKQPFPGTRETSPTRSRTSFNGYRLPREISPIRGGPSPSGDDTGRSRLWLELRDVQKKSKPSSQYSK